MLPDNDIKGVLRSDYSSERSCAMRCWVGNALVIILCLCSGCAKYFYQEGKTYNQCLKDRYDCIQEVNKRLAIQTNSSGGYKHKFIEDCMIRRGYRLVTEDELPLTAKRLDPAQTLHGFLYGQRRGIAGQVDEE